MNHTAYLVDKNGDTIQPGAQGIQSVGTPFRVVLPKVYWPNREISGITASVTVTLHDADGVATPLTQTFSITQSPLTSAGLYAANFRIQNNGATSYRYLLLYGTLSNSEYSPHYTTALGRIFNVVDGLPPANTTYLHAYAYDIYDNASATAGWSTVEAFRTGKDAITVASMETTVATSRLNSVNSVLRKLGYTLEQSSNPTTAASNTAVSVNTASAGKRVYKFLITNGKNPVPETATFFLNGQATEATAIPASAVPILRRTSTGRTTLAIDIPNKLIYIGELQAVGYTTGWNTVRANFLNNLALYIRYAAEYGTHFTDMLNDSMTNVDDPWNAAWGNNCAAIVP
jgi:hypothetical protein